jgi:predicted small metal-binding protein
MYNYGISTQEARRMSKVVRCRDVGVDCDFVARAETEQDVLQQCAAHGKEAHGMEEIPAELAEKVRAAIHEE